MARINYRLPASFAAISDPKTVCEGGYSLFGSLLSPVLQSLDSTGSQSWLARASTLLS